MYWAVELGEGVFQDLAVSIWRIEVIWGFGDAAAFFLCSVVLIFGKWGLDRCMHSILKSVFWSRSREYELKSEPTEMKNGFMSGHKNRKCDYQAHE